MNLRSGIFQGIIGSFLMNGIEIDKIDTDNHILYITLPKESYSYELGGKIKCAEDHVKGIKKMLIEFGALSKDFSVKYKTKNIYWTKEMGDKNYKENINKKSKILTALDNI